METSSPLRHPPSPEPPHTPTSQFSKSIEKSFSPAALLKLDSLKRKSSSLFSERDAQIESPSSISKSFVKWRLACVRSELEIKKCLKESLAEAHKAGKLEKKDFDANRAEAFDEQDQLEAEEKELLQQSRFFEEDMRDSLLTTEWAHIHEMYNSWRLASSKGQKAFKKQKRFSRGSFARNVVDYLGAERGSEEETERWCNALGMWIAKNDVKCAHIQQLRGAVHKSRLLA